MGTRDSPSPGSAFHLPSLWTHKPAYLNAASQDVGGEAAVELGMLLAVGQQVAKLAGQKHRRRVLVQDFGEGLVGSQAAEHHRIVLVRRGQAVQEAEQLLNNLRPEPQGVTCAKQGQVTLGWG